MGVVVWGWAALGFMAASNAREEGTRGTGECPWSASGECLHLVYGYTGGARWL